jgi:hypothetical protein
MKVYAVEKETEGLTGNKCSLYCDFIKNEFRVFNDANGAQLTFCLGVARFIQEQNHGSKILCFELIK